MKKGIIVAIIGSFLAGCSPFSDSVIKKSRVEDQDHVSLSQLPQSDSTSDVPVLDSDASRIIRSYGPTIRKYSDRYGLDWRLVLAVMKQESRFLPTAESYKGATGFMQIMPTTSNEVARELKIRDMAHPKNNIRGGIFYLNRLYRLFDGVEGNDRIMLTLAAYNAGISRVYDAQELAAYMQENPTKWQAVKDALPLLSKRYYTLHKNVWPEHKPRAGWFGNSRETIGYVENIMTYYDEYRQVLN